VDTLANENRRKSFADKGLRHAASRRERKSFGINALRAFSALAYLAFDICLP